MPLSTPNRFNVLGVGVHAVSLAQATDIVIERATQRPAAYVCVTGVHGIIESQDSPLFRDTLNRAYLNTPDGMPMVWLGKAAGYHAMTRVYGPDLMLAVCDYGRARGIRHFFYGGADQVAPTLAARLANRYPGLLVAGYYTPPFRPLNSQEIIDLHQKLHECRADVLWVGLSTPKQEMFMAQYSKELPVGIMLGVGAAFDFHSGRVKQAPRLIQRSGFEWLYRTCSEPRRLAPRYFRNNPRFLALLLAQATRLRRFPLVRTQNEPPS